MDESDLTVNFIMKEECYPGLKLMETFRRDNMHEVHKVEINGKAYVLKVFFPEKITLNPERQRRISQEKCPKERNM